MKPIHLFLALLLAGSHHLFAQQARFVGSGSIEFEKTVNTFALVKSGQVLARKRTAADDQLFFEQYREARTQFRVLKSVLTFGDNKTLFTPANPERLPAGFPDIPMMGQYNTVFADLSAGKTVVRKTVFGEAFLLKDSVRKISWKITDETRDIAGYACRRANALVLDSIYVVAFYAEKIHVAGGPESFTGLPGMILQLALPHEHVIWRATKVTDTATAPGMVSPPQNGTLIDRRQLLDMLLEAGKRRNEQIANLIMKAYLL